MSAENVAPDTLELLQRDADECAELFRSYKTEHALQVLAVSGAELPWRLIETQRQRGEVALRRMHCFESPVALYFWLQERRDWKAYDRALASARLGHARKALEPADDSPRAHAQRLYEALTRDLEAVAGDRHLLKEAMCPTHPDTTLDLLRRPRRAR